MNAAQIIEQLEALQAATNRLVKRTCDQHEAERFDGLPDAAYVEITEALHRAVMAVDRAGVTTMRAAL